MRNRARVGLTTAVVAAAVAFGAAAPANAIIENAGGGEWDHGVSASTTWSYYNHPTKTHRSSVATSAGYYSSSWRAAKLWSFAELESTASGNKAYYDYR